MQTVSNVWLTTVVSLILLISPTIANVTFDPNNSDIARPLAPMELYHNTPEFLPIIIEIREDVGGALCTTENDVAVQISSPCLTVTPRSAQSVNGVITIDGFTALTCSPKVPCPITFQFFGGNAGGACSAAGLSLSTGDVIVQPIPNAMFKFHPSSFLSDAASGKTVTASVNVLLPPVAIKLLTSCGDDDETLSGLKITASCDVAGVTLAGTTEVETSLGVAVFNNLMFQTAPVDGMIVKLTFTADPTSTTTVSGTTLTSNNITLYQQTVRNSQMQFSTQNSLITSPGQGQDVKVNVVFPKPIVVEMVDSTGALDTSDSVSIVKVEVIPASEESALGGTKSIQLTNGKSNFSDLIFLRCVPASVSIVLNVSVAVTGTNRYLSMQTGRIIPRSANYANLTFVQKNDNFFTYQGQQQDIEVGKSIPRIEVELQDGCFAPDYETEGFNLSMSVRLLLNGIGSGAANTSSVPFNYGTAVFEDIGVGASGPGMYEMSFVVVAPQSKVGLVKAEVLNPMKVFVNVKPVPTPPPTPPPTLPQTANPTPGPSTSPSTSPSGPSTLPSTGPSTSPSTGPSTSPSTGPSTSPSSGPSTS
eukprot:PhF_6_TR585/c0_g2_i1/m.639